MKDFIIQLVSMSIQASIAIVVVLVLRLLFAKCKISKKYVMLLWVIPFVCLILPWRIASPIAIWDKAPSDYGYEDLVEQDTPFEDEIGQGNNAGDIVGTPGNDTNSGANGNEQTPGTPGNNVGDDNGNNPGDKVENPGYNSGADVDTNTDTNTGTNTGTDIGGEDKNPIGRDEIAATQIIKAATVIWGMVVLVLALYSGINYGKLKKQLSQRVLVDDNIYMVDDLGAPIVVGFRKPEIYIPSGYNTEYMEYVIAHEQTHIRRKDIIAKMAAYCVTCIHWFNPLVWLAYNLMIKDMEMACDEETVSMLGQERKHAYATALLQLSTGRRHVFSVPLAFGEGGAKMRIVNILRYEKTKQILAIVALAIGIVLAIVFLTKGIENSGGSASGTENTEGVGDTETEIENTENTEDTEDTEESSETENIIDPEEQNIYYKNPDITYDGNGATVYIDAGKLLNYEFVYYEEAVPFFDGVENYEVKFKWFVYPDSNVSGVVYEVANEYLYMTERGGWYYYPFIEHYGTTWENLVLLQYDEWAENKVTYLVYNVLTDEVIATYKTDIKYNKHFNWAFVPETNQALIRDDEDRLFVYENGEMIDYTEHFASMEGWEKRVRVVDGQIFVYFFDRDSKSVMTQLYNPKDKSVQVGLGQTRIENNYTNMGVVLVQYGERYGFAQVGGRAVFIDLLTGDMAEPQIDLNQYEKILNIDDEAVFFYKKNGYWKVVDMETGEVLVQSYYAVKTEGLYDSSGNGDRMSIVVSAEGKAYLRVDHEQQFQTRSSDYYDLGYQVAWYRSSDSANETE